MVLTWKHHLFRTSESEIPPHTSWIWISGGGVQISVVLNTLWVILWHAEVWELLSWHLHEHRFIWITARIFFFNLPENSCYLKIFFFSNYFSFLHQASAFPITLSRKYVSENQSAWRQKRRHWYKDFQEYWKIMGHPRLIDCMNSDVTGRELVLRTPEFSFQFTRIFSRFCLPVSW